jgi:thioredoxin 1
LCFLQKAFHVKGEPFLYKNIHSSFGVTFWYPLHLIIQIDKLLEKKMNTPLHVTDEEFEKVVLQSELPVIVDFWAPWCGPCRMVAPILDKIAKEQDGKLVIAKVNTDENPKWAMQYGVQGIPTMLFVANGKIVHTQVGALPEPVLRDVLGQFMSLVAVPN